MYFTGFELVDRNLNACPLKLFNLHAFYLNKYCGVISLAGQKIDVLLLSLSELCRAKNPKQSIRETSVGIMRSAVSIKGAVDMCTGCAAV